MLWENTAFSCCKECQGLFTLTTAQDSGEGKCVDWEGYVSNVILMHGGPQHVHVFVRHSTWRVPVCTGGELHLGKMEGRQRKKKEFPEKAFIKVSAE